MDKNHQLDTTPRLTRFTTLAAGLLLALLPALAAAGWTQTLEESIAAIDAAYPGELGVYVEDLGSGESMSFRAEESWYLASGVKVPIAIAVMRGVERGDFTLTTKIRLQESDYVDGAGGTNWHPPGTLLSIRYLLEQMLIHSDNTASDMLIRTVGLDRVNAVAIELVPQGFGTITTLADVRRHAYSAFHRSAFALSGKDFFALKKAKSDGGRRAVLAQLLDVAPTEFAADSVDSAFAAYYTTTLNAAPLSAYGQMLRGLAEGNALGPDATAYLLGVMRRVETGERRLKAGFEPGVRFAHKTGTQHSRACDFGIATTADDRTRVIIAACSRGNASLTNAEEALRAVGAAVQRSGVLTPRAGSWSS